MEVNSSLGPCGRQLARIRVPSSVGIGLDFADKQFELVGAGAESQNVEHKKSFGQHDAARNDDGCSCDDGGSAPRLGGGVA